MAIEQRFQEYFEALDRSGQEDRCYLCRRTAAEVKRFFGFNEDGTPIDAARYGLEDVVLAPRVDVMSYRGARPVCAVCQLNFDSIFLSGEQATLRRVLDEVELRRDELWPQGESAE
ncbi:MAG: hypothetical protein IT454_07510 [Planctomycetes bacterium]|nr:hypothetical protein [Planctomycetota bacterium]